MADEVKRPDESKMVADRPDGAWEMDVAAFLPAPAGYIKVGGEEYPVYSFLDVPVLDSVKVSVIGDDIRRLESYDERTERSIEQVLILNGPAEKKLTREILSGLSARQLIMLTVLATSIAGVPTGAAGDGTGASPSGSPASAASTGGASGGS